MFTNKPVSRIFFMLLMMFSLTSTTSTAAAKTEKSALPALLNSDGTLNLGTGYNGNLDASHYGITLDPLRGPVLAPLTSGNDWESFGIGLNDFVNSIVISGTDVYVGGNFWDVGGDLNIDYIAKWDGLTGNWSALGTMPLDFGITALAMHGTDLYAAGGFSNAGGNPNADHIAKWNGTSWSALGAVPFSTSSVHIETLTFNGNDLYVGGYFNDAGGNPNADYIAKWDGTSWYAVGTTPLEGIVHTIKISGTDIYVGGEFYNIGANYDAARIAKWDTLTGNWSAFGGGLNNSVYDLAVSGTDVYAAGFFTDAGGDPNADYIAKWNGTSWSALGAMPLNDSIVSIALYGTNLYVGGLFTNAGGDANADYVAKWDALTGNWSAVKGGLNNTVMKVVISGTNLYVGGMFMDVLSTSTSANHISNWNGSAWSGLDTGLNNTVRVIGVSGSDVYVGGSFTNAGGNANADYLAKWNGTSWSALGIPATISSGGGVYDILVNGSDVYVSGGFSNMGGNASADNIAKWNGTSWSALGSGLNWEVYSLAMAGTTLYAGGVFSNAGGDPNADYLAKWNGTSWSAVGTTSFSNTINKIATIGSNLYISGGGSGGIHKWNGTSWSDLSTGLDPVLPIQGATDMQVSGTDLYVAGNFYIHDKDDYEYIIGKWDGEAWSQVGTSLNYGGPEYIGSLAVDGANVYAGGWFKNAGGDPNANGFAKWDGTHWAAVGGISTHYYVNAIAVNGSDIFIGGDFTSGLDGVGKISIPALPTPTVTATVTETATQTGTVTLTPTDPPIQFITPTSMWTSTPSKSPTVTKTPTATSTVTETITPTETVTLTPTATSTVTETVTPTETVTLTPTVTSTATETVTPTQTETVTMTLTATSTVTETVTPTQTETMSPTVTSTVTETVTPTETVTATSTVTSTVTETVTPTETATITSTATSTVTATVTATQTAIPFTATSTVTATQTATRTITPTPSPVTVIFRSIAAHDGWLLESSENSGVGGTRDITAQTFRLGDDAARRQYRSILSFNTGSLPDAALITQIVLKIKKQGVSGGGNPVTIFQGFLVDMKTGLFGTALAAQLSDFQQAASKTYGTLNSTLVNGWYSINLTTAKTYINKLSTNGGATQMRLRFRVDDNNDAIANVLSLYSGNAITANRPQLVITYK